MLLKKPQPKCINPIGNKITFVFLFSIFAFISAYSEEELILDEMEDAKIEAPPTHNKTKPTVKTESKVPQIEPDLKPTKDAGIPSKPAAPAVGGFLADAIKLIAEKKYSKCTSLLWSNI